ncbi:SAF domain-containing protein [Nocardia brasiliensis]|uniref:SAF domain-containing protein n=1 Tax=Nocardia brasiliensis TaxID=37326 RepID=UPI001895D25F|nr:SAF domain-containing protein [Nocardia brasiliensis]MBF6546230.1 flagella basal body P-ring formation protein FlgA [Nocardia brasiliensis]
MTRPFADLGREHFATWQRPPWADSLLVRRLLAAGLVMAAVVLFLRGDPGAERATVVVAGRDLAPGRVLEADDLRTAPREAAALPAGVVRDPATVLGATLTGAVRAGEVFTDLRVVGSRLAAVATGARDARIVPIRLADTAVTEILRAGDRVDVIGGEEQGSRPARTLATDAAVVLVSGPGDGRGVKERVVLVAMDAEHAAVVAAASLHTALAVVFH